jgi:hypothetical protein
MSHNEAAHRIARRFMIELPIELEEFKGRGNIHVETHILQAGAGRTTFLLQKINTDVFPLADRVMQGMVASVEAQAQAIREGVNANHRWEVPDLVPTQTGDLYVNDEGVWRMMRYIEGTVTYKSLSELPSGRRLETAHEVGKGLALYSDLTSSIDPELIATALPGYRDTRLYFNQLDSAIEGCRLLSETQHRLPEDPEVRQASARHFLNILDEEQRISRLNDPALRPFIELALTHRDLGLALQEKRERGEIRRTAIHGDTKIENFLFCAMTGQVVALVDLDTVMPLTWLADWGDMVRSLCNVAGEKERNLELVQVDREVYAAVLQGFLSTASSVTPEEIALMPRAVQVIALELGIRFLADYLRGDTYFQLGPNDPRDLNKVRAMVQLRLFEKLLEHEPEANELVKRYTRVEVV